MKKLLLLTALIPLLTACSTKVEPFWPQSFEELKGHKVALLEGSGQQAYCMSVWKDAGIEFQCYPSRTDALTAVVQNKADVAVTSESEAFDEMFRRMNLTMSHRIPELRFDIGFAAKKGNSSLVQELSQVIDSLKADGTIDDMLERWMDPDKIDLRQNMVLPPISPQPERTDKVLRIGITGVNPPYEVLIDNKWTGYEIELLQRFAAARGYDLKLDFYQLSNLISSLDADKIDLISSSLFINEERQRKVDFAAPHFNLMAAFCVLDQSKVQKSLWTRIRESAYYSLVAESRWELIAQGFVATLKISVLALLLGSILGALICWMNMSRSKALKKTARIYVIVNRNLPMLVLLLIMFYVVLAHSGLSADTVSIITFAISSSAYFCEVFRTGIQAVSHGQLEAGRALGFSAFQSFLYIIAPQAAVKALPVYKNECISLLKGTSVVGYISVLDMTKASDLIRSSSLEAFFPLLVVSALYFLLAWLISVILDKILEKLM